MFGVKWVRMFGISTRSAEVYVVRVDERMVRPSGQRTTGRPADRCSAVPRRPRKSRTVTRRYSLSAIRRHNAMTRNNRSIREI